jgi:hypothetical protein
MKIENAEILSISREPSYAALITNYLYALNKKVVDFNDIRYTVELLDGRVFTGVLSGEDNVILENKYVHITLITDTMDIVTIHGRIVNEV